MLNDLDKDGVVGGLGDIDVTTSGSEVEWKVAKRQAAEKPAKKLGPAAISGRLFLNCKATSARPSSANEPTVDLMGGAGQGGRR